MYGNPRVRDKSSLMFVQRCVFRLCLGAAWPLFLGLLGLCSWQYNYLLGCSVKNRGNIGKEKQQPSDC